MSREHHDHFAKALLADWLEPLGPTQVSRPLAAEERTIDMVAHAYRPNPRGRRALGLLGRMARGWTGFEVFRNPVGVAHIRSCAAKHHELEHDLRRLARRQHRHPGPVPFWVISPTLSSRVRSALRLEPRRRWPPGFLDSGAWGVTLVVVHDLPETSDTLFLRVFGRGAVQARALVEVNRLPRRHPLRQRTVMRVVNFLREATQARRPTRDHTEFLMKIPELYLEWEREVLQRGKAEGKKEGKAEGKVEGKAEDVLTVLRARGLTVPPRLRSRVQTCTSGTELNRLLRRAAVVDSASDLFR